MLCQIDVLDGSGIDTETSKYNAGVAGLAELENYILVNTVMVGPLYLQILASHRTQNKTDKQTDFYRCPGEDNQPE